MTSKTLQSQSPIYFTYITQFLLLGALEIGSRNNYVCEKNNQKEISTFKMFFKQNEYRDIKAFKRGRDLHISHSLGGGASRGAWSQIKPKLSQSIFFVKL